MEQIKRVSAQGFRYVLTGGTAAVVDASGFHALHEAGLGIAAAAAVSFCAAAVVNYVLTSRYVFDAALDPRRFLVFFLFAVVGFGINVSLTVLFAQVAGLPPLTSKIGAIGIAFLINFALNAAIVFRRNGTDVPASPSRRQRNAKRGGTSAPRLL
jgi:putative flippase GtrA